jgi:hypothetical protein
MTFIGLILALLAVVPSAKADLYDPADWAPMVWSDKADYAPGEHVELNGANWTPGESVHIRVNDDTGSSWDRDIDVTADETGAIADDFNLPSWFVASYRVTATGASGAVGTHTFTDANPQSVQIAPGSRTVAPGWSADYTVTVPITGSDGQCTLDLSASGLPAGVTATFTNASLTGTKGDSPSTSLTVATTSATVPGTTTFTVTATRQSNCQGSGNLTGTANLVVAKSVGAVAVGAQTGALTSGTAGSATYPVTVNRNGATGTAFTANLTAPSLPAGATASFSPSSVSFASGDTSKTSTLTITTTPAAAAGSTPFTVRATNPNATGDFSDGNGTLLVGAACTAASVTTQPSNKSITYGANATFTAAGAGNPAPSLQWQVSTNSGSNWTNLSGETGTSLTIAKPGVSQSGNQYRAVFTNTCSGTQTAASSAAKLTVAAKAITVTPDSGQSKVYGASDPTLRYTATPALESGDGFTGALSRAVGENAGSYAITLGNLSAGSNYAISLSSPPVSFAVTKKAATLTAVDKTKVYGSDDPALSTTDSGFLAADLGAAKIAFSASRAAGESVAGGPYTITPAASDGATSLLGNYDVTYKAGELTVTKKAITGSFKAAGKVYDGNTDAVVTSRDLTGLVGDDAVSLVGGSAAFDTKNTGTAKTVTLTGATLSGDDAGNYRLASVATTTANISPKPITVKADDKTKVYGSADPALTVTVPNGALESGDSLSGSLERAAGKDVGGYNITKGSLTAGGNYELTVTLGSLTITRKAITVKADDKTKVYGSADPALTVTAPAGALESGDSLSGSLERAAGKDVGNYAITKGTLTAGGNYELTVTPGSLTITKKAISVTADDKSKVVGAVDPALTYKVTSGSLESGDSFSGALTRAPGETVATYAITRGTLTAGGNYDLTFAGSTLKIVYGWDGFLQPINDTAHQTGVQQSKFKLGQTIPAKFLLKNAAGAVVRQATDPAFTRSANLGACDSTAAVDTTEVVAPDAGSTFTWDGSQYHYNWSTKNLTAGEYRIYANLADGTKPYVDICLAK